MSQNWHDEFEIFTFSPISVGHVHKLLKGIPIRKAFGLDGINGRFLTAGASVIARLLTHIFRLSLQHGCVPSEWKLGKITPVHKSGTVHDPNQYRQISVISCVMKIFERIVHDKLIDIFVTTIC